MMVIFYDFTCLGHSKRKGKKSTKMRKKTDHFMPKSSVYFLQKTGHMVTEKSIKARVGRKVNHKNNKCFLI